MSPPQQASSATREQLAPALRSAYDASPATALPQQRMLSTLVGQALQSHQTISWRDVCLYPLLAYLAYWACSLGLWLLYHALHWAIGAYTDISLWSVAGLMIFVVRSQRGTHEENNVRLVVEKQEIRQLNLGRWDDIFQAPPGIVMLIAILVALQEGLLNYTHSHLWVPGYAPGEAWRLTLDNFCAGAFLDIYEMYGIEIGRHVEHNDWSATAFFLFRTSFSAMCGFLLFLHFQRSRLRRVFRRFPDLKRNPAALGLWLNGLSDPANRWMFAYLDEFVFLRVTGEYLQGHFDEVRRITAAFPRLAVSNEVRRLFVDPEGVPLFVGYRTNA